MKEHAICYVEIGTTDMAVSKAFYAACFGWQFQDMGADYAMFGAGDMGGGLSTEITPTAEGTRLVISVDSIPQKMAEVADAGGGVIGDVIDIGNDLGFYQYFTDPVGNKLAVWAKTNS